MLLDRMQRILNKFGLIAYHRDLPIFGQRRGNCRHSRLDVVDNCDRVRSRLFTYTDRQRLDAVQRDRRCRIDAALFDTPDVLDLDRKTVVSSDDDVIKLIKAGLADSAADRVTDNEHVRREFGLK